MSRLGRARGPVTRVSQSGQDKTEYALLVAVILFMVIAATTPISKKIGKLFSNVDIGVENPHPASPPCELDKAKFCQVEVFFATDRKPSGQSAPAKYFSGERNDGDEPLTFGTLKVSIPSTHRTGHIEEPLPPFTPDVNKDIVVFDLKMSSESQFDSSLASAVAQTQTKEALVFIHGFDTTFDEAARRTAQLAWDLQFRGVPILYSWPSKGSKFEYTADEATASWSIEHLKRFLELVSSKSGASTIHIVAHSLGNRELMYALQQIALEHSTTRPRFRQVVLAAPDIDAGVFKQLASLFPSVADRVTIYASAHDRALGLSNILHASSELGRSSQFPKAFTGIDVIDASVVADDLLGFNHSSYAEKLPVLEDMGYVIRLGLPPSQRSLLDPHPSSGDPIYWTFRP